MLCPGCGHPLEETTSGEADPANRDGAWHYEVDAPHRCHACTALAEQQQTYQGAEHPHALRWRAVRIDSDDDPGEG